MIMKRSVFKYWGGLAALLALFGFIGCSDEPDEMNYYTFKGQMMSDYLLKTEQFSDFATLVNRAGMMDMLPTVLIRVSLRPMQPCKITSKEKG